jgi:hypothetical protein
VPETILFIFSLCMLAIGPRLDNSYPLKRITGTARTRIVRIGTEIQKSVTTQKRKAPSAAKGVRQMEATSLNISTQSGSEQIEVN